MRTPKKNDASGQGWAMHVMMGDNREGWFAKPYEPGRRWILMMHSGRELFDKSKRLIVKRKLIYLSYMPYVSSIVPKLVPAVTLL